MSVLIHKKERRSIKQGLCQSSWLSPGPSDQHASGQCSGTVQGKLFGRNNHLRAFLIKTGILSPLPVFQYYYSSLQLQLFQCLMPHPEHPSHATLTSVSCCGKSRCGELQESIHITLLKPLHRKDNCNFWSQRWSRARCYDGRTQQICFTSVFKARKKVMCFIHQQYAQMLLIPSYSF